jgi:hypothetical protein
MIVAVALLGSWMLCLRVGITFINSFIRQKSLAEHQRDSQIAAYGIIRDIRNAQKIQEVSDSKLVLRAFNTRQFNYDEPDLFDPVNVGTITYQFKLQSGLPFLERKLEFTDIPGGSLTNQLLKNLILTPDTTNYVFKGGPGLVPPYDTVEVVIRLKPPMGSTDPQIYREVAFRRGTANP